MVKLKGQIKVLFVALLIIGAYCDNAINKQSRYTSTKKIITSRKLTNDERRLIRVIKQKKSDIHSNNAKIKIDNNQRRLSMVSFMLGMLGDVNTLTIEKILKSPFAGKMIDNFVKNNRNSNLNYAIDSNDMIKGLLKDAPLIRRQVNIELKKNPNVNVVTFINKYKKVALKRRQFNLGGLFNLNMPSFKMGQGAKNFDLKSFQDNPLVMMFINNLMNENPNMKVKDLLQNSMVKGLMKSKPDLIKKLKAVLKGHEDEKQRDLIDSVKGKSKKSGGAGGILNMVQGLFGGSKGKSKPVASPKKPKNIKANSQKSKNKLAAASTANIKASKGSNSTKKQPKVILLSKTQKAQKVASNAKNGSQATFGANQNKFKIGATTVKKNNLKPLKVVKTLPQKSDPRKTTKIKKAMAKIPKKTVKVIKKKIIKTEDEITKLMGKILSHLGEFSEEMLKKGGLKKQLQNGSISKMLAHKKIANLIEEKQIKSGYISSILKNIVQKQAKLQKSVGGILKKVIDNKKQLNYVWNSIKSPRTLSMLASPNL